MASAAGQGDDDFDFADDTAVDEQADFDWDDLDEPEQSPAAKPAPKPATATPPAAPAPAAPQPPPALAVASAPQPTPILTKVGPIPFRDPSPPAAKSPAAPSTIGTPGVARQPSAATAAAAANMIPSTSPAAAGPSAGTAAASLPQRSLAGLAAPQPEPIRAGGVPQQPPRPLAAPTATTPPVIAAGTRPVQASTPPARQYSASPGRPAPSSSPSPAATAGSPQVNLNPAALAGSGPPPSTYAAAGSLAASGAAEQPRLMAHPPARPPALGATTQPPASASAAAGMPEHSAPPPEAAAAAAPTSTAPVQTAPAAISATSASAPDQATRHPGDVPASKAAAGPDANAAALAQGSSKAGGGWGGWGLGGFTNKLQQVALGAAKDLQELTASVQQVVAEVVAADDISEVDRLSAYQERPSRPGPAMPAAAAAPPTHITVSRGDSAPHLPGREAASSGSDAAAAGPSGTNSPATAAAAAEAELDSQEEKQQEVLKRLQGEDTQLESGLKAIDDQVDILAASAAKALGSLWGGFSTVAKQTVTVGAALTAKVEAAAKEVAKELAVGLEEGAQAVGAPGAAQGAPGSTGISLREAASNLAARAERTLESVGRGAVSLLDPQFGRAGASGSQQQMGGGPPDWAATFDSCFELYGGAQAAEELEHLSSECAHICNRARANLQLEAKQQIDATLTKLAPAFDLRSSTEQQAAPNSREAEMEHLHEAIEQLYLPVRSICSKGKHRASQLQQEATEAAVEAAAVNVAVSGTAAAAAGSTDEIQPEENSGQELQEYTPGDPGSRKNGDRSQLEQLLQRLLAGLRSVAVKSLAEVSAGQLMLLLSLGCSLAALPRYGKPLEDGLEWPADPEAVAQVMHQQAQAMLSDMQQLAAIFKATAPAIMQALQDAATAQGQQAVAYFSSELAAQQAKVAAAEVEADCGTALGYVRDGFSKLLYVVLLASLHRAGLPEQQDQAAKSSGSSSDGSAQETVAAPAVQQGA